MARRSRRGLSSPSISPAADGRPREPGRPLGKRRFEGGAIRAGLVAPLDQPGDAAGTKTLVGPPQGIVERLVRRGQEPVLGGPEFLLGGADVTDGPPES